MKASLMAQHRELNEFLLILRRRHRHSGRDKDDEASALTSGVVVVKETSHVTNVTQQCLDDTEDETASNSDSGTSSLRISTSSDNGLHSVSVTFRKPSHSKPLVYFMRKWTKALPR